MGMREELLFCVPLQAKAYITAYQTSLRDEGLPHPPSLSLTPALLFAKPITRPIRAEPLGPSPRPRRNVANHGQMPWTKKRAPRSHAVGTNAPAPSMLRPHPSPTMLAPLVAARCRHRFRPIFTSMALYRKPGPAACSLAARAGYFSWTWICVLVASA